MRAGKRFALAVCAATFVMFLWGGLSHMVLITGIGFSRLPDEPSTIRALESSIVADGLYFFPGTDLRGSDPEERASWERRFRAGPTGFIVYHPRGGDPFSGSKLGVQLLSNGIAALLAALVIARVQGPLAHRAGVGASLGAFSSASVATIYWNWYGYPTAFFLAQCADVIVGSALVGLVLATLLPPRELVETPPPRQIGTRPAASTGETPPDRRTGVSSSSATRSPAESR